MNRIVFAAGVGLLAGIAVAGLVMNARHDAVMPEAAAPAGPLNADAGADDRLARLEQVVREEREARLALEDTLAMLFDEIERLESTENRITPDADARSEEREVPSRQSRPRGPRDEAAWMRNYAEQRIARLVEGGFSEEAARRILEQESEAAFLSMQKLWEAQRSGQDVNMFDRSVNPQALLRDELGDAAYARYLEAQGMPTSVRVTQVLSGSPANNAGLQPGDELVSYNGERVFNVGDLRELTMQGEPGQDVVIEVDRDGVRMQLTVPRGPMGITGSGANVRGMNWWGS